MIRTAKVCGGGADAAARDHGGGRFGGVHALGGGSCEDLKSQRMESIDM